MQLLFYYATCLRGNYDNRRNEFVEDEEQEILDIMLHVRKLHTDAFNVREINVKDRKRIHGREEWRGREKGFTHHGVYVPWPSHLACQPPPLPLPPTQSLAKR